MTDNATDQPETSPEAEGTPEASPEQAGTESTDQIALYRKRQAGAEAARVAAEKKLADAERELAAYRAQNQTASEKDLSEVAKLTAQLEAAELRATEAEAKATARVLDSVYPNARKELPEVTDEVRLAKFEAMLAEVEAEAPTPRGNNPTRTGAREPAKPKTIEQAEADLRKIGVPWAAQ